MLRAVQSSQDDYLSKLVKYVPVEGLAPALILAAGARGNDLRVIIVMAVALLVGAVLMLAKVRTEPEPPRFWFWPFMIVAFAVWTIGSSTAFSEVLGIDAASAEFFLGLAAFALPALDTGLVKIFPSS